MLRRLKLWLEERKEADPQHSDRFAGLQEILGFTIEPEHKQIFLQALRHRSIIDDDLYKSYETYERLEFLGDAVLDLIVSEILYQKYPTEDEGFLTKIRAKLVKGDTLARIAGQMKIHTVLELGERAGGQNIELSKNILADVFESIIAAIYITYGYQFTFELTRRTFNEFIDFTSITNTVDNHKSVLMEFMQARKLPLPIYEVISESGPGHDKTFHVSVSVKGEVLGEGHGKNKKTAEQEAAKNALSAIGEESE